LSEGVLRQEIRRLLRAVHEIDIRRLEGQAEERQEQLDAVAMAGKGEAIEPVAGAGDVMLGASLSSAETVS
jgi:hypothetical protein